MDLFKQALQEETHTELQEHRRQALGRASALPESQGPDTGLPGFVGGFSLLRLVLVLN